MKKIIRLLFLVQVSCVIAAAQTQDKNIKTAELNGIVTNFGNKPLTGEIIMLVNETTGKAVKVSTDKQGKFSIRIPVGATYDVRYKNFTADVKYTKMVVPDDEDATYNVTIKIQPAKEFVIDNLYFDTGKSAIKQGSHKVLNDLVEVLKLKSTLVIEIQGHTDNVGGDDDNMKLSQARAGEVRKYLISKGIDAARIVAKGYGPTRPVADNGTEAGRAKNRRTSLKVISE